MAWTFALIAPVHPILHRVSCSYETIPNTPKHYETHQNMSLGSNGVDRVRSLRKITCLCGTNFCINCISSPRFAPSPCSNETIPNAPKHYTTHQNMRLGSNGWIGCVRCEKSQCDFVARTFALIEPGHPVLHQVWCSYEMVPNTPKHYATHQNLSLGSNGVDWVRSLWKIPTWLRGKNFCINCTSSVHFTPSLVQ